MLIDNDITYPAIAIKRMFSLFVSPQAIKKVTKTGVTTHGAHYFFDLRFQDITGLSMTFLKEFLEIFSQIPGQSRHISFI